MYFESANCTRYIVDTALLVYYANFCSFFLLIFVLFYCIICLVSLAMYYVNFVVISFIIFVFSYMNAADACKCICGV